MDVDASRQAPCIYSNLINICMASHDIRNVILLIESAEHLDEADWKKALATAALAGTLGMGGINAKASDTQPGFDNKPIAAQQADQSNIKSTDTTKAEKQKGQEKVEKHHEMNTDISLNVWNRDVLKKLGVEDPFTWNAQDKNVFKRGLSIDQLLPYIKLFNQNRPANLGEPISKFKIEPSDRGNAETMGVIEYENGRMEVHMMPGFKGRSEKNYVPLFLRWESKDSPKMPSEFDIDFSNER